ncbi:LMWPc domain-containing protein [Rhizoctonia solani AG-1 IA]|uniref:protein-tyrosine-phosphatase n=1 Tax=Thanatephorus cucumeris (strain AG1-IA) TaxID=983506 RepID=L8X301_THACA|nr:LMWPc domain-containing protein [Rhizoctonia solani AG-1 IA]
MLRNYPPDLGGDGQGTAAYHVGELPDERYGVMLLEGGALFSLDTLGKELCQLYSVPINHHARAVKSSDFKTFDYILASDNNLSNLKSMAPKDSTATIALFGAYGDNQPIADPYYGGIRALSLGPRSRGRDSINFSICSGSGELAQHIAEGNTYMGSGALLGDWESRSVSRRIVRTPPCCKRVWDTKGLDQKSPRDTEGFDNIVHKSYMVI